MTNPNSYPDFSDPEIINAFFDSHPDFSPQSDRRIDFIAEVEEYSMRLAIKEADAFAYIKQYLPSIGELQETVLSKTDVSETPTLPDLIAELAIGRRAIAEDTRMTEAKRAEIMEKLDYTLEIASVISDIAAKMLYPEIEQTISDIKQFIENGEHLSDIEKAVLISACDNLLTGE